MIFTFIITIWAALRILSLSKQVHLDATRLQLQVGTVESTCHIRDSKNDGSCGANEDCGVDGSSCRQRSCSEHGFCVVRTISL